MAFPSLTFPSELDWTTRKELEQLVSLIQGFLSVEHKDDGRHGDITADSVTLAKPDPAHPTTGQLIVQDQQGFETSLDRTTAGGAGNTRLIFEYEPGGVNRLSFIERQPDNSLLSVALVGKVQFGPTVGHGIAMFPPVPGLPAVERVWSIFSGSDPTTGPAMIIGDNSAGVSPLTLRWNNARTAWEFIKTTGTLGPTTELVTIGSPTDSSLTAYIDEAYVKRISMQTVATQHAFVGDWTEVAFSAGDFTASGAMTWTVIGANDAGYEYRFVGTSMLVSFYIVNTTVGGTPAQFLQIAIPGGFTAQKNVTNTCLVVNNGVPQIGYAGVNNGGTIISLGIPGANWANGVGNNDVRGQIEFPIA